MHSQSWSGRDTGAQLAALDALAKWSWRRPCKHVPKRRMLTHERQSGSQAVRQSGGQALRRTVAQPVARTAPSTRQEPAAGTLRYKLNPRLRYGARVASGALRVGRLIKSGGKATRTSSPWKAGVRPSSPRSGSLFRLSKAAASSEAPRKRSASTNKITQVLVC
jgi:hypothetical protein